MLALSHHARHRMRRRRISTAGLRAALDYGRRVYVRGALVYALGHREVAAAAHQGVDLAAFAGVHVVCTPDEATILTIYRNHDLRGLKPRRPRRR